MRTSRRRTRKAEMRAASLVVTSAQIATTSRPMSRISFFKERRYGSNGTIDESVIPSDLESDNLLNRLRMEVA
jgi:hypothetical protein